MTQAAAGVLIVVFVCTAAWWDATAGRIPNELTMTGLAAALILRAPLGIEPLLQGLGGSSSAADDGTGDSPGLSGDDQGMDGSGGLDGN